MSLCENCGRELEPGEVCNCQKKQKKPIALIAGAAAAVLVIVVVVIVSFMGSGSYKTPVKKLIKLVNNQSTDAFAYLELGEPIEADFYRSLYSSLKKDEKVKEGFDDLKSSLADFYEDIDGFKITECDFVAAKEMKNKDLRTIADRFDSDYYESRIEEIDELDKSDYEDLADKLNISAGDAKKAVMARKSYYQALSKVKITEGYEVTLRIYGKYKGEEDKTEKIQVQIIKVNGKWCIYKLYNLLEQLEFQDQLKNIHLIEANRLINEELNSIYIHTYALFRFL